MSPDDALSTFHQPVAFKAGRGRDRPATTSCAAQGSSSGVKPMGFVWPEADLQEKVRNPDFKTLEMV